MTLQELEEAAREIESGPDLIPCPRGQVPAWLGPDAAGLRGIGPLLDHTLLRPEADREQIIRLCEEALALGAHAVCVHGGWVSLAADRLRGSPVRIAAVVGFPLGAGTTMAKFVETRLAIVDGATEIDMVMALGRALGGEWAAVEEDINSVVDAADGLAVKVIVESAALTPPTIIRACLVAKTAGARMVKTSTGFHSAGGATVEAVKLMRKTVGPEMGVKASGGIATGADAIRMLRAGASRIGASNARQWSGCLGQEAPLLGELLGRELGERDLG